MSDETLAALLRRYAAERGPGATFCPSEVARALADDWRPLMPQVRAVAEGLVAAGKLRCTQRGQPVRPLTAHGAIRLGQAE